MQFHNFEFILIMYKICKNYILITLILRFPNKIEDSKGLSPLAGAGSEPRKKQVLSSNLSLGEPRDGGGFSIMVVRDMCAAFQCRSQTAAFAFSAP